MKLRSTRLTAAAAAAGLLSLLLPAAARAQLDRSTVRGQVVDEAGQPLAGVKIEIEYKGESRQKIVKKMTSDKKGAYIYMGLLPGPWSVTYSKDGFKSARLDTALSGGGLSEIPDVVLKAGAPADQAAAAAPPPIAMPAAATGPGASAGAGASEADRARQLASFNKALEAMRAGQDAEAEKLFRGVLAEIPGLAPAHQNLGHILARRGDAAGAEAEYRKVIELQPASPDAYLAVAVILSQGKRSEEAFKLLQDASAGFAQDPRFQFALGATAFDLGRGAEAEAAFAKVTELEPANAEPHFYLASLALNRSDTAGAVSRLEKYLALAPEGAPNVAAARGLLATLKKKR
jgi:Flp pilus assembly protein TadD